MRSRSTFVVQKLPVKFELDFLDQELLNKFGFVLEDRMAEGRVTVAINIVKSSSLGYEIVQTFLQTVTRLAGVMSDVIDHYRALVVFLVIIHRALIDILIKVVQ